MPTPTSAASGAQLPQAAKALYRQVSRVPKSRIEEMFPPSQRSQWPSHYVPASGVAYFLQPGGVPFHDVLDCAADLCGGRQEQRELQRDFAADYTLWHRCVLEDALAALDGRRKRTFRKLTARDRLNVHDAELRSFFGLAPYVPPPPASMGAPPDPTRTLTRKPPPVSPSVAAGAAAASFGGQHQGQTSFAQERLQQQQQLRRQRESPLSPQQREKYYEFTPYAATQELAMAPVSGLASPHKKIHFSSFPQIRNVLYRDFDSMSALRALSLFSGDDLLFTTEFVQAVTLHLNRRLHELLENEERFIASAQESSEVDIRFSHETPILACFGNGRLAWALNESGLLPSQSVRPVQLPAQAARRQRRHDYLQSQKSENYLFSSCSFSDAFTHQFPVETLSVGDALRKYRPGIVIVEPHVDRDWLADIRGFFSVREVIVLGLIDSPAMGSFAYPFLTFGVTPGPNTYWAYNRSLQRVMASDRIQLPVDPPHELQGYERVYADDISAWMISPNDCPAIGNQYRCLRFVRTRCPVVKRKRGDVKSDADDGKREETSSSSRQ